MALREVCSFFEGWRFPIRLIKRNNIYLYLVVVVVVNVDVLFDFFGSQGGTLGLLVAIIDETFSGVGPYYIIGFCLILVIRILVAICCPNLVKEYSSQSDFMEFCSRAGEDYMTKLFVDHCEANDINHRDLDLHSDLTKSEGSIDLKSRALYREMCCGNVLFCSIAISLSVAALISLFYPIAIKIFGYIS